MLNPKPMSLTLAKWMDSVSQKSDEEFTQAFETNNFPAEFFEYLGYPKGWSVEQCFSWMHNRMRKMGIDPNVEGKTREEVVRNYERVVSG
jgi:hypothetical protein